MKVKKRKKEERKKNRINLFILLFNYNYFDIYSLSKI